MSVIDMTAMDDAAGFTREDEHSTGAVGAVRTQFPRNDASATGTERGMGATIAGHWGHIAGGQNGDETEREEEKGGCFHSGCRLPERRCGVTYKLLRTARRCRFG